MSVGENSNPFPKAIDASRYDITLEGIGRVAYYHNTCHDGVPLLLLHSINAAPSAMEVKPLFQAYRNLRPVYALDLPGFGASERRDREYSCDFFSRAIHQFVVEVIGKECDVVALSLTCEFIALASLEQKTPFRSMCMISPTGFSKKEMPGSRSGDKISRFLRLSLVGSTLFRLLTIKPSIRYFLGQSFKDKPPQELFDYAVITVDHPSARFAPFSFVSGKLFDNNATENLYLKLTLPVQVLYDWDPNISFELLPRVASERENWHVVLLPDTMGLPHWTQEKKTSITMDSFWSKLANS